MSTKKTCIGITLGDCAGIGPEIIQLALKSDRLPKSADYKIIGKYPQCSLGKPTAETARAAVGLPNEHWGSLPNDLVVGGFWKSIV